MRCFIFALCLAGCAAVPPAQTNQEHCPYEGAHPHAAKIECPYEVIGTYLQGISDFAHRRWDPQRTLANPNEYVERHGGRALMAVLNVRVDAFGKINETGLQRSSGVGRIDSDALGVFPKGESMLYPPSCALSEGSFRFNVGLCVEVIRPKELHIPGPTDEPESRAEVIIPGRR
jgi:hypothetical protein